MRKSIHLVAVAGLLALAGCASGGGSAPSGPVKLVQVAAYTGDQAFEAQFADSIGYPAVYAVNKAGGEWAIPQKAVTGLNRYGNVDEVAALVAFVAGPESSYITGANLTVDGGMNA